LVQWCRDVLIFLLDLPLEVGADLRLKSAAPTAVAVGGCG